MVKDKDKDIVKAEVTDTIPPAPSQPSEVDLLRAEVAALRAKTEPKAVAVGRAICNACGIKVKEGDRCETHTTETVNVCLPDGSFRSY